MMLCTSTFSRLRWDGVFVQFVLPQNRAQGRLGEHVGGRKIGLDLDDGALGIDHVEVRTSASTFIDTLSSRNDITRSISITWLRRSHTDHLLDERYQQHQTGALDLVKAPQGEDDGAFVFTQDLHLGGHQRESHDQGEDEYIRSEREHSFAPCGTRRKDPRRGG